MRNSCRQQHVVRFFVCSDCATLLDRQRAGHGQVDRQRFFRRKIVREGTTRCNGEIPRDRGCPVQHNCASNADIFGVCRPEDTSAKVNT